MFIKKKMELLSKQCAEIAANTMPYNLNKDERRRIADELTNCILNSNVENAVNCEWYCVDSCMRCGVNILSFIHLFDEPTMQKFMENGLDLNHVLPDRNGVASFIWSIGNAENLHVYRLLTWALKYQTSEQRGWVNTTDYMTRIIPSTYALAPVRQTALQLCVAKGYTYTDGLGHDTIYTNFAIAVLLLQAGAHKTIDYQEPYLGNTALHIASARRDTDMCKLLENFKTDKSLSIQNKDGKTPAQMEKMSYKNVCNLLKVHTSPDGTPNTFELSKCLFESDTNIISCCLS
jgi:hypothetical protein